MLQFTDYTPILSTLPIRERPTSRVASDPSMCALSELLAVIIGGQCQIEIAQRLLARFGTIREISQASVEELDRVEGITNTTAIRLRAALALGRRLLQPENPVTRIHSPQQCADILMPLLGHQEQEHMAVVSLTVRNDIIHIDDVYRGCVSGINVRNGELLKPAVIRNASSVIIAHNHPSGDPSPSPDDIATTRSIVEAGKILDINVIDHMIIGFPNWVSLKERGIGFN